MRRRATLAGTATALGVAAAAAVLIATGALGIVQRPIADLMLRMAAEQPPPHPKRAPKVAVVALDPYSLRAFPDWPWPRSRHAELVRRLDRAGARAIAFDIDFSTPRPGDAEFARAISASRSVVLAAAQQQQELAAAGSVAVASVPTSKLARAAAGVGSVHLQIDPDGVVRRATRASRINGAWVPALADTALAVALREPVVSRPRESFEIDYRRSRPEFPVIPAASVLNGSFDPLQVTGRIVLVGATASELQDIWSSPLGPARPGVELQALAVRTLAAERAGAGVLRHAGLAAEMLLAGLVSLLAVLLGASGHWQRLLGLGALAGATMLGSLGLLIGLGLRVDPLIPLLVIAAHYALGHEIVRLRFGRRLAQREMSLATLFQVGQASAQAEGTSTLEISLALLGDVVQASGVALFRMLPDGEINARCLEWCREPGTSLGDPATAAQTLFDRRVRIFEGGRPGASARGGMAVYTPLFAGDLPVGVLVVERLGGEPLEDVQLRTIATVGTQLALSAHNVQLLQGLRETFAASVEAVASAIEARDGYTEMHCHRIASFSVWMATRLGLGPDEVEGIRLGALLHDVGKIGIRDDVLLKPGRLTSREREDMERHPDLGRRIVEVIPGISRVTIDCILHHHEWWDGSGYPHGLAGSQIPQGARIVAIIDVWDALSTARLYKAAYPQQTVRQILQKASGAQFDPELLELFLRILEEEGEELMPLDEGRAG